MLYYIMYPKFKVARSAAAVRLITIDSYFHDCTMSSADATIKDKDMSLIEWYILDMSGKKMTAI